MTPRAGDRIERVREVLDLAMERPAEEREEFAAGLCAGDEALRLETASLLRALGRAGHLLEPAGGAPAAPGPDLSGLTLGPYKIDRRIGAGGMGVVYRAHDTRLGRTVAVKSLPPDLALDPVRRAMIEREARMLAALNHPNIAAIYGIEASEHGPILALEFVEGPTLAEHLAQGRLTVEEARTIANQILLALEAAHAAGIVHRDIKPSNIKLGGAGSVKVLDFGIAKLAHGAGMGPVPGSNAIGPVTEADRRIGTPAYMSPEQARGRPVDRRTDLWAFGCVLYEMLAGMPAFRGETATDTIAAILRAEPEWSRLPASTPLAMQRLLRRCLDKDPEHRLRDAGDARLELDEVEPAAAGRPEARGRRWATAVALIGAAALLGAGLSAWLIRREHESANQKETGPTRLTIDVSSGLGLGTLVYGGCMSLSPDGRSIVYSAGESLPKSRLYVRRFDAFDAQEIPGTVGAAAPAFSPDGKWIAYEDMSGAGDIRKIRVVGGSPEVLAPAPTGNPSGVCWPTNDEVIFTGSSNGGLWMVPASGGAPRSVTRPAETHDGSDLQPTVVPDSRVILFTRVRLDTDRYRQSVEAINLDTGQRRRIMDDACQPSCLPGGHLLYYQAGALTSVEFDASRMSAVGEPRRVLSPVAGSEIMPRKRYTVSPTGTLAYLPSTVTYDETDLMWAALDGPITPAHRGSDFIDSLRLSPDGKRVAYAAGTVVVNIWVHDLIRGGTTKLTEGDRCYYPVWTPDGGRIVFQTRELGLQWMAADGTSGPETLFTAPAGQNLYPNAFTPDGKTLLFTMETSPKGLEDLFLIDVAGDRAPRRVFPAPSHANRFGARLSPDGAFMAYTSEDSGQMEIYVQPFPALDRKIMVSTGGGFRSAWSGDGKTLYYRAQDRLFGSTLTTTPNLTASAPRLLLQHLPDSRYDAAPDGTRFIFAQAPGGSGPQTRINVVLNWAEEAGLGPVSVRR